MSNPEQVTDRDRVVEGPSRGRRLVRWAWALVLLSLLGGGGYLLMRWEPRQLPVRVVTVTGALEHLSSHRLQETVIAHLNGGILTQDLAELKTAVETIPWVRSASLRRRWPDRLELEVVERVALARWGEDALVGTDGVIFKPAARDIPPGLPEFSGTSRDAPKLVQRLLDWKPQLQTLGIEIETLARDARGAWTLHLSAGFRLALGKVRVQERISRFIRAYPALTRIGIPSLVDMRYSNGLAVRWAEAGGDSLRPATATVRSAKLRSRTSELSRS